MFENHSFRTYAKFSGRLTFLKPWYAHVFQFRTKYWVLLIIEKVWSNYLKVFDLPLNITWNKISFQKIIPEVKLPLKQFFRWTYLANGLLAVKKFFVLPSDEVPALFSPKEKFNVLFSNIMKLQAFTVVTVHVTCTQTESRVHENSCALLIPLSKDNMNQSVFFLLCAWLPPSLVHRVVILVPWLRCADFIVCFHRRRIFCPAINQTSPSQSKGCFPFNLICKREKYHWTGLLSLRINYTNLSSEKYWKIFYMWEILVKFGSHIYEKFDPIKIFSTEESKQALRMILPCITSCKGHELWKMSTVFVYWCYEPVTNEN